MRTGTSTVVAATALLVLAGCETDRDMAESVDMPDTMEVHHALEDAGRRKALLDTMPGGEMARGDSLVEHELLRDKMPDDSSR